MLKKLFAVILTLAILAASIPAFAAQDVFVFDRSVTKLFIGGTLQTVLNRGGAYADGEVTYTSSAPHIASVDDSGLVTGLRKGEATVTARLASGRYSTITLTVSEAVTSIALNGDQLTLVDADALRDVLQANYEGDVLMMPRGTSQYLHPIVLPETANDRMLTVKSSDSRVLSTDGYTVRAVRAGECDLTLTSRQNPEISRTYHVLVTAPVERVTVKGDTTAVNAGESITLTAVLAPADATVTAVTWKSVDPTIATVDDSGVVTGVSRGSTQIRAYAMDGSNRYGSCTVEVRRKPDSVSLNIDSFMLPIGHHRTLETTVLPKETNNKRVTWTSADPSIATVDSEGTVRGVSRGWTTITATCVENDMATATAEVRIVQPVITITFDDRNPGVVVGERLPLSWTVGPKDADCKEVTFSSSNASVATVDDFGVVTGLKGGKVTITASATDGSGKKGSVTVQVIQPVTGVHLRNNTVRVGVGETATLTAVLEPDDATNHNMTWVSADPSIVTVRGTTNRPTLSGRAWGTTTVTGVTEDGGYAVTATVKAGNLDKAITMSTVYVDRNNKIRMNLRNSSDMVITKFTFRCDVYDMYGNALVVTPDGETEFSGSYSVTMEPGTLTQHGRYSFGKFEQPEEEIGALTFTLLSYTTADGYKRTIKEPIMYLRDYTGGMVYDMDTIGYLEEAVLLK